jgi:hypothetical protein
MPNEVEIPFFTELTENGLQDLDAREQLLR